MIAKKIRESKNGLMPCKYYVLKYRFHRRVCESWIACDFEIKDYRDTKFKAF